MSDNKSADTPQGQAGTPAGTTPPAVPTDTPATSQQEPEMVSLSKEEVNQLKKQAAIASTAQRKADRLEKLVGRRTQGSFATKPTPEQITPPTQEELNVQGMEEDRKAKDGLIRLALDPKYRELFDNDSTLRDMLTVNPLGLIPALAPNALDAEEAIDLIKENFDGRLEAKVPSAETQPPVTEVPATPPTGGVNVSQQYTETPSFASGTAKDTDILNILKKKISG